jgi:glutamate 5-kinase
MAVSEAFATNPGSATQHRRVVVKVGTNLLTGGGDRLDRREMGAVAAGIASARERGCEVLLVSSGAIAAGVDRLNERRDPGSVVPRRRAELEARQVLAAVGQSRLMATWDALFAERGVAVAQALLTRRDLADRRGYLNARNTLLALLALGVVPIVNENDVVSVEEIEDSVIGDNDNLSAQVANLVDADLLLILTDTAGLYTSNPATDPAARLIERIERITPEIERAAGAAGRLGTGGMVTKLQAARIATSHGAHVVIADGRAQGVIERAAAGEQAGTHFLPTGDRVESRRRYLLSGFPSRGCVRVDDGAARALSKNGGSLLPAGVTAVEGTFDRGDVVKVLTGSGAHIASGIANYSAADLERIRGLRSDRIADVLGHDHGDEVVHRNNLALL